MEVLEGDCVIFLLSLGVTQHMGIGKSREKCVCRIKGGLAQGLRLTWNDQTLHH